MIQLELPFTLDDYGGMDAVYVDQAPLRGSFVSAFYTPLGIKSIDGEFVQAIMSFDGNKEDYNHLRNSIMNNVHLHSVIKQNLIFNLENMHKQTFSPMSSQRS